MGARYAHIPTDNADAARRWTSAVTPFRPNGVGTAACKGRPRSAVPRRRRPPGAGRGRTRRRTPAAPVRQTRRPEDRRSDRSGGAPASHDRRRPSSGHGPGRPPSVLRQPCRDSGRRLRALRFGRGTGALRPSHRQPRRGGSGRSTGRHPAGGSGGGSRRAPEMSTSGDFGVWAATRSTRRCACRYGSAATRVRSAAGPRRHARARHRAAVSGAPPRVPFARCRRSSRLKADVQAVLQRRLNHLSARPGSPGGRTPPVGAFSSRNRGTVRRRRGAYDGRDIHARGDREVALFVSASADGPGRDRRSRRAISRSLPFTAMNPVAAGYLVPLR